jgi:tRNA modification GTPase
MLVLDDTIAAIASAPGGAARGIVRVSGPRSIQVISQCFRAADPAIALASVRRSTAIVGEIRDFKLPCDLLLWPTQRSYTRQPLAEIHTVGSQPLLAAVLRAVCDAGARLAHPGEFTLRAFLAGRLDLTQAEAILGVIDARDRRQLETALNQLAGGLSKPLSQLRNDLLDLLADLEAGLDFVEDDIRFVSPEELDSRLTAAIGLMEQICRQFSARKARDGVARVVLAGPANVGKSSLFNALTGSAAAITSPQPGTTRDYLSSTIDIDGLSIELIDTAGVDNNERPPCRSPSAAAGSIDSAAQFAALGQRVRADLQLRCIDSTNAAAALESGQSGEDQFAGTITVLTKCDLNPSACDASSTDRVSAIATSGRTGLGLDRLKAAIYDVLCAQDIGDAVPGTAARAGESIHLARDALAKVHELSDAAAGEELVAAELRAALDELGKVVGAMYTDDLLDRIFSRFCIGK